MNCDQTQPLLDAFADGELGRGMAWRVRRHLAVCLQCTSELAEVRQMSARVRAWRDLPAPAGLSRRLAALPAAAPPPRRSFALRRAAGGLAGLAAAAAAFVWLTPGQPGRPTIAFADVERAMASINVMDWTTEITDYGKDGNVTKHQVVHNWMRRSPLAQATIVPPQPSLPQGSQTLEDERGFLDILPNGKGIVWRGRTNVLKTVTDCASLFTRPLRGVELEDGTGLERVTLNGKSALKATLSIRSQYGLRVSLWIDPVTNRVIQMETRAMSNGKPAYVTTETQMRYDETPPPGVFDIAPPPGAKIKYLPERTKQLRK